MEHLRSRKLTRYRPRACMSALGALNGRRGAKFPLPQWLAHAADGVIVPAWPSPPNQRARIRSTCVYMGATPGSGVMSDLLSPGFCVGGARRFELSPCNTHKAPTNPPRTAATRQPTSSWPSPRLYLSSSPSLVPRPSLSSSPTASSPPRPPHPSLPPVSEPPLTTSSS